MVVTNGSAPSYINAGHGSDGVPDANEVLVGLHPMASLEKTAIEHARQAGGEWLSCAAK